MGARAVRLCHYACLVDTFLDNYFKIGERGSTVARELRGGVVTFFTMSYIVVLNPLILGFAADDHG